MRSSLLRASSSRWSRSKSVTNSIYISTCSTSTCTTSRSAVWRISVGGRDSIKGANGFVWKKREISSTVPFTISNSNSNPIDLSSTLLDFKDSKYESITVDMTQYPVAATDQFTSRLSATIEYAKSQGKKCIYLNFDINKLTSLMSEASTLGFKYHHAEGDKAVLLNWIAEGECKVPIFASHHVGVGGAVFHKNKLLVVREAGFNSVAGWKLPGGLVDLGEELGDAASREVREETGLHCDLVSVLTFRHSHNIQFGRSDMYVICYMQLRPGSDETIKLDESEIVEAKWMTLDELSSVNRAPLMNIIIDLLKNGQMGLLEKSVASIVPGRKPFKLYQPDLSLFDKT